MEQKETALVKLVADEGKIIVSKEKIETNGVLFPKTYGKEVYIACTLTSDDFEEIDESEFNILLESLQEQQQ